MPRARTEYRIGPDGLPARVVGTWVEQKVHYVDAYTAMFGTAMKNAFPRRAYVELFAGPGMSWDRQHGRFIAGSAIRALEADFTDYCFVDIDPIAARALNDRVDRCGARTAKRVSVFIGDCNAAPAPIRSAVPPEAIALAFVDPTTWQVTFDAIAKLVDNRRVDLMFTFHAATMRRMVQDNPPALTAFFGTGAWKAALKLPREERTLALLRLYNEQLATLGYQPNSFELAVPVRNTLSRAIYHLVLFSKHPLGVRFWRDASRVDRSGQSRLW